MMIMMTTMMTTTWATTWTGITTSNLRAASDSSSSEARGEEALETESHPPLEVVVEGVAHVGEEQAVEEEAASAMVKGKRDSMGLLLPSTQSLAAARVSCAVKYLNAARIAPSAMTMMV